MLQHFNISVPKEKLKVRNVAGVIVTGILPPYARAGTKIDVEVATLGDADSLKGGFLLQTPLFGPDKEIYAVAQGPVTVGEGIKGVKLHPTVGKISEGAIIEKELVPKIVKEEGIINLVLNRPDFTNANRIKEVINAKFGEVAETVDASLIRLTLPADYKKDPIRFIAEIEELNIIVDTKAVVVVNARTGTVVMGEKVVISPIAISHGDLSLEIKEEARKERIVPLSGITVAELIKGLNALKATPQDIIAILEALKAAGALHGELIIM
jgi:flagellar P-ring protein precursor FlgI